MARASPHFRLCSPPDFGYVKRVSTLQETKRAVQTLPRRDAEALREWLENYLEDEREMTDEFKAKIERAEKEMAAGKGRVRNPQAAQ